MKKKTPERLARRSLLRAAAQMDGPRRLDPAKIIARRKSLGLTQAEVAMLMGCSREAVARMETGGRIDPRLSTAAGMAQALSAKIEDFI